MINFINLFFGSLISVYFYIYFIRKVFSQKIKIKAIYIFILLISITIINIYNKDIFKIFLTLPLLIIYFKFTMDIPIEKGFFYVVIATVYLFLGEILTGLIFSLSPKNYDFIFNNVMGKAMGSLLVTLLSMPFIHIKFISNIFKELEKKLNVKRAITLGIIIITIIGAISYKNTHSISNISGYIMNTTLYLMALILIYIYFLEVHRSNLLEIEYINLIKYIEKYEKELEEKRKMIHDFNNQLIVINGYVDKENEHLKNYIKEIIKDQKNLKANKFINGLSNVPIGLKGLIYYKFVSIQGDINLYIESKNMKKFEKLPPKLNKDILKIMGILIDNSIESIEKCSEKDITILMEIKKGLLKIEIDNSINSVVDIEKIANPGYSTKGKNRGYGLSIVHDISKSEKNIDISFSIKDSIFKTNINVKL